MAGFGLSQMAGIAFDDGRREAWVCRRDGTDSLIAGLEPFTGGSCSNAELEEPYGLLNFFDVRRFLLCFGAQDPAADLNNDADFLCF